MIIPFYIPVVVGFWMISTTYFTSVKGAFNILLFKVIPFFLGLASIWVGAKLLEWV
jgi:hypothetical protein